MDPWWIVCGGGGVAAGGSWWDCWTASWKLNGFGKVQSYGAVAVKEALFSRL